MRLDENEIKTILDAFSTTLPAAKVFLFGSRTKDTKKGGDIDLLIKNVEKPPRELITEIKYNIFNKLGEQKIDILFESDTQNANFIELIKNEAVELKHD